MAILDKSTRPPIESIYPRYKPDQFKLYCTAPVWKREELRKRKLRRCWRWKVIEPAQTKLALTMVFVQKKDVTLRFCVIYRKTKCRNRQRFVSLTTIRRLHLFSSSCQDILHTSREYQFLADRNSKKRSWEKSTHLSSWRVPIFRNAFRTT